MLTVRVLTIEWHLLCESAFIMVGIVVVCKAFQFKFERRARSVKRHHLVHLSYHRLTNIAIVTISILDNLSFAWSKDTD